MERLKELFRSKPEEKIISVFFTAGYPQMNRLVDDCAMLENAGADMIEIGIPCSDPLADGPVIQYSSTRALQNGMKLRQLFLELEQLRPRVKIPVLLMGYYNQVLQYGEEKIVQQAKTTGVDGFIIPDLPSGGFFSMACKKNDLANVRLVCPTTSAERIQQADRESTGFLYAVSASSTTGNNKAQAGDYFKTLSKLDLKNPVLSGFGIRDRESFTAASMHTRGGIIGTAFVEFISQPSNLNQQRFNHFIQQFK